MRIIEPLEPGNIYHIYNCGVNGTNIFQEKRNYYYFMRKYEQYCSGILETYAYAFLKNHFHLLVKVKENATITRSDGKGETELLASKQLSHFFNCYVQSFNKAYSRHGTLLEQPFRRKMISSDTELTDLIYYIHFNPQQHRYVNDFREWEFTSWHTLLDEQETFLDRDKVMEWFGGSRQFRDAHLSNKPILNDIDFRNKDHC